MPRGRPRGSVSTDKIKPRGRMSAYAFFVQTCREEHKKLHPEESVAFGVLSKQCSERWQTMSDIEKEKFHEMADKDKHRFKEEMKNYTGPVGGRRARRQRGMKKIKDPNKPKRALSAFFYYANDERPNVKSINPDFSVGEVAKELGRQWGEMTEAEKSKYEKQAEDDRARYDVEMTKYRQTGGMNNIKLVEPPTSNGHTKHEKNDSEDEPVDDDDDDDDGNEEEEGSE